MLELILSALLLSAPLASASRVSVWDCTALDSGTATKFRFMNSTLHTMVPPDRFELKVKWADEDWEVDQRDRRPFHAWDKKPPGIRFRSKKLDFEMKARKVEGHGNFAADSATVLGRKLTQVSCTAVP